MANTAWGLPDNSSWGGQSDWGTQNIPTPTFDDIYKGADIDTSSWNLNWGVNKDTPDYSDYRRSNAPSWLDIGKAALDIATGWKSPSYSTSAQRSSSEPLKISSPAAEVRDLGYGFRMIRPADKVTQKTYQGSSGAGIGGTIGQIAGLGAGLLLAPASGGASAALSAASLGSGIGGTVGRTAGSFFG